MTQTLRNGVETFTNGDPYNLADDVAKAFNTANVVIKVGSLAAQNTLASKLGPADVGTPITRTDLPASPQYIWDGAAFLRTVGANHLEIGLNAPTNQAGTLWGPGSPAVMQGGIDATRSSNTSAFTFPFNNAITVANDGMYSVSWLISDFSAATSGFILLTNPGGTVKHSASPFTAVLDIALPAVPNIRLLAGETLSFNFQTTTAVSCKHRIRLTKIS